MRRDPLFPTHFIQQNRDNFLRKALDRPYRFCYTLETLIAKGIISQRRCQGTQLNPLKNDTWEANNHQPPGYHEVI